MSRMFIERASIVLGVPVDHIKRNDRHREAVRRRQAIAHVMRDTITILGKPISYPHIGRILGGYDHSTIIHNIKVSRQLVECDEDHAAMVDALEMVA